MKNLELLAGQTVKLVTRKFISEMLINSGLKNAGLLEISPGNKPVLSREIFPNLLYADYFDTEGVKTNNEDRYSYQAKNIQKVDIVLSKDPDMEVLKNESIKGVASSHVFEHFPNPIQHLRIIERIVELGGVYVLIVPDKRACFDVFRHPTDLGAWLSAYLEGVKKPKFYQHFDGLSRAVFDSVGGNHKQHPHSIWSQRAQGSDFAFPIKKALDDSLKDVAKQANSDFYGDCHCSVFTPASLHLLLVEINLLGLTSFWPIHRTGVLGEEFVIILEKGAAISLSDSEKNKLRLQLCQEVFF